MKRTTKAQRKKNASKRSKQKRISKALKTFLRSVKNPASMKKYGGAKIRKNKGGSITIIPVKLPKAR